MRERLLITSLVAVVVAAAYGGLEIPNTRNAAESANRVDTIVLAGMKKSSILMPSSATGKHLPKAEIHIMREGDKDKDGKLPPSSLLNDSPGVAPATSAPSRAGLKGTFKDSVAPPQVQPVR